MVVLTCVTAQCEIGFFFCQAEDGIRDAVVTGVQTCALPICWLSRRRLGCSGTSSRSSRATMRGCAGRASVWRSEEHTSELQSRPHLVCRLLLEKKKKKIRLFKVVAILKIWDLVERWSTGR